MVETLLILCVDFMVKCSAHSMAIVCTLWCLQYAVMCWCAGHTGSESAMHTLLLKWCETIGSVSFHTHLSDWYGKYTVIELSVLGTC